MQTLQAPVSRAKQQAVLLARLNKFTQLKAEVERMFNEIEREATDQFESYKKGADAEDILVGLAKGISALVMKGFASTKLTAEALEKLNEEVGRDGVKLAYDPIRDKALELAATMLGANSGQIAAIGSGIIQGFLDYSSVTFWTRVLMNKKQGRTVGESVVLADHPDLEVKNMIQEKKRMALAELDAKINFTRILLQRVGSTSSAVPPHLP